MKKEEKIKYQLEREKFNYDISRSFLIPLFNNYIVRTLAIIGFFITLLQIDPKLENLTYYVVVLVLFLLVLLLNSLNYKASKKKIEKNLRDSAKKIDAFYEKLVK